MEIVYGWKRAVRASVSPRCCDGVLVSARWPRGVCIRRGKLATKGSCSG